MIQSLAIVVILAVPFAVSIGLFLYDRDGFNRMAAWLTDAVPSKDSETEVYIAYLKRHNAARLVGGLVGMSIGLVLALRWTREWTVSIGVVAPIPENVLVWWLGGVVIGAIGAEAYRLPRRGPIRQALLHPRQGRPLPRVTWMARGAGTLALISAGLALALHNDAAGLPGAIFAILVIALVEATQSAIIGRPRPASEAAVRVDSRLRWHSGASLAWLELAGAILGLATGLPFWQTLIPQGFAVAMLLAFCGLTITTVVAIVKSRQRPPRRWQPVVAVQAAEH